MVSFPAIFPSYQLTDLSSNLIHLSTPFFFSKIKHSKYHNPLLQNSYGRVYGLRKIGLFFRHTAVVSAMTGSV